MVKERFELLPLNTLRISSKADYFVQITEADQISTLLQSQHLKTLPKLVLGGGSNVLFTQDYHGLILKMEITGRKVLKQTDTEIIFEVAAGENWHQLVTEVVNQGWGGIENLALIPGTVGAAPVQNIAAYGQNLVDSFDSLDAVNLQTGEFVSFQKHECEFAYRESIFKNKFKDQFLITAVRFRFAKHPNLETSYHSQGIKYESVTKELAAISQPPYSVKDVYQAVVNIRTRQLPSVEEYPSAGSFFKNPIVSVAKLRELQQKVSNLQFYPVENLTYQSQSQEELKENELVKVAAGRLLDELGWRGKQIGNCRTFEKHALIVTHNGQASGKELLEFITLMQQDVERNFQVKLEPEVRIV